MGLARAGPGPVVPAAPRLEWIRLGAHTQAPSQAPPGGGQTPISCHEEPLMPWPPAPDHFAVVYLRQHVRSALIHRARHVLQSLAVVFAVLLTIPATASAAKPPPDTVI